MNRLIAIVVVSAAFGCSKTAPPSESAVVPSTAKPTSPGVAPSDPTPADSSGSLATVNTLDKEAAPASQPAQAVIAKGPLDAASEANFIDSPFADVMALLSDYHKVSIKVDPSAAKANEKSISIEAQGSLREVLTKILDPLDLTFVVVENEIVIKNKAD